MSKDLLYKVALNLMPNIGPVTVRNLVSYCGGVIEIFQANKKTLESIPGVGPSIAKIVTETAILDRAEQELVFMKKNDVRAYFYLDEEYPKRLNHINDAPALLFVKGNADLNPSRTVGIVGTRNQTPIGIANCEALVEYLNKYNVTIVSGMAFGIDITAHKKACDINMTNLGIVAHGLDTLYPAAHKPIEKKLMLNGAMISEFPSKTIPDKERFPMRNRIIAGMSDALVIVETAASGGSMITADMAFGYNKDLFAYPGRPQDVYSQGCNTLIKRTKAYLTESGQDVVEQMMWPLLDQTKEIQTALFVDLSPIEQKALDLIRKHAELSVDQIAGYMGTTPSETASILLQLEFSGLIKNIPGKRYIMV